MFVFLVRFKLFIVRSSYINKKNKLVAYMKYALAILRFFLGDF